MYRYAAPLALFFILMTGFAHADDIDMGKWEEGRNTFKVNCASCHNPMVAQTGPALTGVTQRWEDAGMYEGKTGKQWLYTWIRDWSIPVNAKYPYAVKIQNYSPSQMNVFPAMTDREIDNLLLYVENPQAGAIAGGGSGSSQNGSWGSTILIVLLVLVVGAMGILLLIMSRNNARRP